MKRDRRNTRDPNFANASGRLYSVAVGVTNLYGAPDGARDRQLLYGDQVLVFGQRGQMAYGVAQKDGYHGWIDHTVLDVAAVPTHRVTARMTHLYTAADIKSVETSALSFGSCVTATRIADGFAETDHGFIPLQHLSPMSDTFADPLEIAALFLGTAYLWGGNAATGIDCSGLVQAALLGCGLACPGDSDQQEQAVGDVLPKGAPYRRGDLLFWPGHVALVETAETLIHATAHSMRVLREPIDQVIARIEEPVTAHKRTR